jgi:hypothetical protein
MAHHMLKLKTMRQLVAPKEGVLNIPALVVILITVVIAAVLTHVGIWFFLRFVVNVEARSDRPLAPIARHAEPLPRNPELQVNPKQDLAQYLNKQNQWLNSYGYLDQSKQTAHIPIDRAMQMILEQKSLEKETNENH